MKLFIVNVEADFFIFLLFFAIIDFGIDFDMHLLHLNSFFFVNCYDLEFGSSYLFVIYPLYIP